MKKHIVSTVLLTTICMIWIGYAVSIISRSNAPIYHIFSIPVSQGVFPILIILTIALLLFECAVIFGHKVLFTLLSIPFVLLLLNAFLLPSVWLSLDVQNATQTPIKIRCINVSSHAHLSRTIQPQKDGHVVLNEGESKELLSKEIFIILAYDSEGNILYSKRMTGEEIFDLEQLIISGDGADFK